MSSSDAPAVTETHDFTLSGMPTLRARLNAAQLFIQTGAPGAAHIEVTKRVRASFFSQTGPGDLERVRVNVTQDGDTISIENSSTQGEQWKWVTVEVRVTIPRQLAIDAQLNAGTLEITGTDGPIALDLNAGSANLRDTRITGSCRWRLNAGKLDVRGTVAPDIALDADVNAGALSLWLPTDTPATLDARAQVASVSIDGWAIETRSRFVTTAAQGPLGANPTGSIKVRANAGSVAFTAV